MFANQLQLGMQQAVAAYQQGNWPEAERLCRQMLGIDPGFFDALHLLGIIAAQTNRAHEAVDLLSRAVAVNPNSAEAHNNRGNLLRDLGRYDEALQSFECAVKLDRGRAESHNNKGAALQHLGRLEEALGSYDRALKIRPDYPEAHSNRGAALQALNRPAEALKSYERALKLNPAYALAYYNRGNLLRDLKRNEEALQNYDDALKVKPAYAEAFNNRGNALRDLRRYDEALQSYDRALQLNPHFAEAFNNRGFALQYARRYREALESFDRALQIKADYAEAHNNRGSVLRELGRREEALQSCERALAIDPQNAGAYGNRGAIMLDLGRCEEALASFEGALKLDLHRDFLFGDWLNAKLLVSDWHGLNDAVASLTRRISSGEKVSEPFTVIAVSGALPLQRRAAEICAQAKYPPSDALPALGAQCRHEKIRIGYFSADFRDHPVSILTAGLFEQHDRAKFEVNAFSFGPGTTDPVRARLENAFDKFIDVQNRSDKEVAMLARNMELDIAIDLGGFTRDCRTGIFAMRAAPVQVNFLGYPATMGAEYIDYMVADATIVPEAYRQYYSEKIAYLPSYQPNDSKRRISDRVCARGEFGLPETGFVFCSFNKNYKIAPATFGSWMRILKRVDGSVLWLTDASEAAKNNMRKEAVSNGVAAERLVFAKRLQLPEDHLARHRLADLFLDTLPYNAHTTASDALWAGLPVLTLVGEAFAGRVAASLLTAIGLPELVTSSQEDYEVLAVELAANPEKLGQIRRALELNRPTALLFDTGRYARAIENAYAQMVERRLADLPPDHIYATL